MRNVALRPAASAALRTVAIVLVILFAGACARPVSIGSGPGPGYNLEVENQLGYDAVVSYDDGNGAALLGTVRSGTTERFVIAAPRTTTVTITATDTSRDRSAGPFAVALVSAGTAHVTLR